MIKFAREAVKNENEYLHCARQAEVYVRSFFGRV